MPRWMFADIGLTDDELAASRAHKRDCRRRAQGRTWQATPGLFAYAAPSPRTCSARMIPPKCRPI
ncbi:MAG: hypothetical protein ACLTV6_13880 [Christensenellales bacterium]